MKLILFSTVVFSFFFQISPLNLPNTSELAIAFTSGSDGDDEIYLMNTDGTNIQQITFNEVADTAPRWSPDARQIAFLSNMTGAYQIYIMDSNGQNIQQLTNISDMIGNFAWSYTGEAIIFTSGSDNSWEFFIVDITAHTTQSLENNIGNAVWFDLSPNGQYFAYVENFDEGLLSPTLYRLMVMDLANNTRQELIRSANDMGWLLWARNNQSIFYVEIPRVSRDIYDPTIHNVDISSINYQTRESKKIVDTTTSNTPNSLSNDGNFLIFSSRISDATDQRISIDLFTLNLTDSSIQQLTTDGSSYNADWRPHRLSFGEIRETERTYSLLRVDRQAMNNCAAAPVFTSSHVYEQSVERVISLETMYGSQSCEASSTSHSVNVGGVLVSPVRQIGIDYTFEYTMTQETCNSVEREYAIQEGTILSQSSAISLSAEPNTNVNYEITWETENISGEVDVFAEGVLIGTTNYAFPSAITGEITHIENIGCE